MGHSKGYLKLVKQANMSNVLKKIWSSQPVSRVELVEETKLTSGTITNLTQELIKYGLLVELEHSTGAVGRRRVMLSLNKDRFKLIGIDIGRNTFEIVLTNLTGDIIHSVDYELPFVGKADKVLIEVKNTIEQVLSALSIQMDEILGIGLSIPGPMDLLEGKLLVPPNFPGWRNFDVKNKLERHLARNIMMNDDARSSAIAERWFGHGRKENNFLYVALGQGIGGGVVSNGELLLGPNHLLGQIGHITAVVNGERCECGNYGCLETVCSIPGILKRWNSNAHNKTIHDFFQAVNNQESEATQCLEETLCYLEASLVSLFNIYDPDLIILGGKLYQYLEAYLPRLRQSVKQRVYPAVRKQTSIASSSFGISQSAVGAASLVFGALMEQPLVVLEEMFDK